MTVDRKRLRALAQVATPGPWGNEGGDILIYLWGRDAKTHGQIGTMMNVGDARFIAAANPHAVLALLDALDAAEAVIQAARDCVRWQPSDSEWCSMTYGRRPAALADALAAYDARGTTGEGGER